jgi:hypothetical protein
MAIKKTTKKAAPAKADAGKTAKDFGMFSWFFKRDKNQSLKSWLVNAGIFTGVVLLGAFFMSVVGFRFEFMSAGAIPPPSVWETAKIVVMLAGQQLFEVILSAAVIFLIGMFAVMPRKPLDRKSFVAILWTSLFLIVVLGGLMWAVQKYINVDGLDPAGSLAACATALSFGLLIAVAVTLFAFFACVACFARGMGVSKAMIALGFPLGWSLYEYAGHFVRDGRPQVVKIKYNWYARLIEFFLNTTKGQIILWLVAAGLLVMNIFQQKWSFFIPVFFAAFYFWRGGAWVAKKIRAMSVAAIAYNLILVAAASYVLLTAELTARAAM